MTIEFFGVGKLSPVLGGAMAAAGHQVCWGSRDKTTAHGIAAEIGIADAWPLEVRADILRSFEHKVPAPQA